MGGCTSCFIKRKPITSLDEKPKTVVGQHQTERKSSISGDFWTTSVCDMDNSAQGSMSSVSTSIQVLETHAGVSGSNPPSEFVNHGLLLWNHTRQHWIGNKKQASKGQQIRDPKLSVSSALFSTRPAPAVCKKERGGWGRKLHSSTLTVSPKFSASVLAVGMLLMKAYWEATSHLHSQYLLLKWWIFLWTSGSRKECTID